MFVYGGTLVPDGIAADAIVAADPRFLRDDFLAFASGAHRNVHAAIASGDPRRIAALTTEALRGALSARIRENAWSHPVERVDHASILEATHGAVDTIVVRFGSIIAGRQTVEDWTFERSAVTYPHLQGVIPTGCVSCGAPLQTDASGDCLYCGTHLVGVAGDWHVRDVVPPRVVEGPASPLPGDALGPDHGQEDLLAFARSIHRNVHAAVSQGRVSSIRDVLTHGMRQALQSDPEGHGWGVTIQRVDSVDIVGVARGALEVVTVRFRVTIEEGELFEDWTFERPASLPGRAVPKPTACTFCGAPLSLDERGNCTYCATHLFGVAGDWRLSRVAHPAAMVTHPAVVRLMQSRAGQIFVLLFVVGGLALALALIVALVRS